MKQRREAEVIKGVGDPTASIVSFLVCNHWSGYTDEGLLLRIPMVSHKQSAGRNQVGACVFCR